MINPIIALLSILAIVGAAPAGTESAARVQGDYVEARTADIYTGPCFANAELFLTGHQAVLAWKVNQGSWDGVDVSGLAVAAAVRGTTTFGHDDPSQARAVLIVDQSATPAQHEALVAMARTLGGERLARVEAVRTAKMNVFVEDHEMPADATDASAHHHTPAPKASFWAPGLAEILTRPLDDGDHFCGNEVVEYAPLSSGVTALPAYTLSNSFRGEGLGTTWNDPNCRSSFVGHFRY